MKKIVVLGPIPRDHIVTHHGQTHKRYGAALHTAIVLSKYLGNEGMVYQVSHVQKADKQAIVDILSPFDNINTDHVSSEQDRGDVVSLRFVDQNKRLEKQTGFMPAITNEDVEPLLDADAFVCVPITDYEVPLSTLRYIKENSSAKIIYDAHGPTTGLATDGTRFLKFWADRDRWLPFIDVLKMNREESRASWFKNEYTLEELAVENLDDSHLDIFGEHCVNKGVSLVVVTLDENGAALYYKEGESVISTTVDPKKVAHVLDTTGCGDSFAGGLGFGIASDYSYVESAKLANLAGAYRTQGNTFAVFNNLENKQKELASYNELLIEGAFET
ncbi:MAG: carbohydrate kinase family protein [Bacteroidia bacterium]